MVLTLSIPGIGKRASSRSKRPSSTTSLASATPTASMQDGKLSTVTSSNRLETTSTSTSSSTSSLASHSSTLLSESLRGKPFEARSGRPLPDKAFTLLPRETPEEAREREELNDGIAVLARLFPDIKIAVFRELLARFDGDSRLHVCVDQLLRYPAQNVRGRWRTGDTARVSEAAGTGKDADGSRHSDNDAGDISSVPAEELFRSKEYKAAVKLMLARQFPALKEGTVDDALADVNYSFSRARPMLRELSRNSWRPRFGIFLQLRGKRRSSDLPPTLFWEDGQDAPSMRESGCAELDKEVYDEFVAPVVAQSQEQQIMRDMSLAEKLNAIEAEDAEALYECCCCLSDVTFERIAACSTTVSHFICFTCIQRTMHQAVFGQGWASTVDSSKATLQCLAPLSRGTCDGVLDCNIVKRAVLADKSGLEIYRQFEGRLAERALAQSQLKLIRCPFCTYAEVDPIFHPSSSQGLVWQFRRDNLRQTIPLVIFMFDILPLVVCLFLAFLSLCPGSLTSVFQASLRNISLRNRSRRFVCSNPSCGRQSCLTCHRPWKDPHSCHEHLFYSLRDTIEAARTAAVKRTCARCGLSFVRASGCNKMVCVCGSVMCYICRKPLGPNLSSERQRRPMLDVAQAHGPYARGALLADEPAVDLGEAEGYRHFCEHFRANPDYPCTKCTKCNLYAVEDDEVVARGAAEKAEREWRISQGIAGSALPPELERQRCYLPGNTMPRRRRGKGRRHHHHQQQHRFVGSNWDWDDVLRFLTVDLWQEERWEGMAQNLVDRLVETVVVVVDN